MTSQLSISGYKRYISYMYMYKNGIKENNIGFVKLEAKEKEVKLTVSINSLEIKDKEIELYMFCDSNKDVGKETDNNMQFIKIDSKVCEDAYYSATYRTNIADVFESGIALTKTSGVVIMLDGGDCIGTKWENKEIAIEELKQDKLKKELIMNLNKFNESEIIHNDIGTYDRKEDINSEDNSLKNKEKKDIELESTWLENFKTSIEEQVNIKEEDKEKDVNNDKNIVTLTSQAKKIFANFPGMYPFEDDEIRECVKLEPNDIGIFSMDKWPLATNSFLLHGYYTYRHLIFARMRNKNTFKYILGVPGIFRDRERFMASMFGFKNFKGVRNKPLSNGEFGYWYLEIKL